jgi:predicted ribosome quality control (RQC) complex YloA/Tae2 family protein
LTFLFSVYFNAQHISKMKTQFIYIPSLKCEVTYTIGQNASDNDAIIDAAGPNDIWFHVNNKPSCHVIATVPDDINRSDIKYIVSQGVVLCKKNSYPSEKKLPILFTRVKNIQKTNKPGQVFIPEECQSIKVC